MKLNSLLSTFV